MKKIIIFVLFSLFLGVRSDAQCLKKMFDASGIDISASDLVALQDSACELRKKFPVELKDSFAVVDFGFYAFNENMEGGYPEFMNLMMVKLATDPKTKYYLLFGRQTDKNGPNTKVWVKAKLPHWGHFKCLTEMERSLFQIRLENEVKKITIDKSTAYITAEKATISKMRKMIMKIVDCCDGSREDVVCAFSCPKPDEFRSILQNDGFVLLDKMKVKVKEKKDNTPNVENYSIKLDLEAVSVMDFTDDIQKELIKRKSSSIYITDDEYYCKNGGFNEIMPKYKKELDDYDVIIHLRETDNDGNGEVWVKVEAELYRDAEEDGTKQGSAKFTEDPIITKNKEKIAYAGMLSVPTFEVPVGINLLKYPHSPSEVSEIFKNGVFDNTINTRHIFDISTGLYYGFAISTIQIGLVVPSNIGVIPNNSYNILLMKSTYEKGKVCLLTKNIKWSSITEPKKAQYLAGTWKNSCHKNDKDVLSPDGIYAKISKLGYNLDNATTANEVKTYFKHISSSGKVTYIHQFGKTDIAPNNVTIIDLKENGDGTITPKVNLRSAPVKNIVREPGKGKSGVWKPFEAKKAFETSFAKAIKNLSEEQKNSDNQIKPDVKRKSETILTDGWLDLDVEFPGIEYKSPDIIELLSSGIKTFNEVVDNAKIPDEMWQKPDINNFPVKDKIVYPSGTLNGVAGELKGDAQFFGMIADCVLNPSDTKESLKNFASGVTTWNGAKDVAGGFATGIIGLDMTEYNKGGEYQRHAAGVVIGTIATQAAIAFASGGTSLIAKAKDAPKKFQNIMNKLSSFKLTDAKKYSESLSALAEDAVNKVKECDVECLLGKVGCLTGNTMIETVNNEMQPIRSVKEGTFVSSYNHNTKQKELKSISKIQRFLVNTIMVLTLSTGNTIEATPNHPFFARGEYREAQYLNIGDTLFSKNEEIITLNRIFAKDTTVEVFNIAVIDNDNYFAGADALLTKECLLKNLGNKYKALGDKVANLSKEARARFLEDFADAEDAILDVLQGTKGIEAWEGLKNTPAKTNVNWLNRAKEWLTDGAELIEDNGRTLLKNQGSEVAEIKNGQLLPFNHSKYENKFPLSNPTTVGEAIDGYQIVRDGNDWRVRRVPNTAPYLQSELTELTQHPDAHVLERHGPDVSIEALSRRATDGIAPDGSTTFNGNPPSHSSKFETSQRLKDALSQHPKPGTAGFNPPASGNSYPINFPDIGEDLTPFGFGIPSGGGNPVQMNRVKIIYKKDGGVWKINTMYPQL
jgi:hypothetical protein